MDSGKEKVKSEIIVDHVIPIDILDDLGSRFIINVPEEERKDLVRLCFQIELAHWYYLDFICKQEDYNLKTCGMKEFARHMFKHVPALQPHAEEVDSILSSWREYKMAVPTFGAIILNEQLTHVLLVQSYFARSSWGFPKGKVNFEEDPAKCAVREVLEETGFDISRYIDPEEYIESNFYDQMIRLYVICGVSMDTTFKPRTRNEIKAVEWFPISDLPTSKKDMTPKLKMGVNPNSFFMVVPFLKRLRRWIFDKQHSSSSSNVPRRTRHRSMGDVNESAISAMVSPSGRKQKVDSPDNLSKNGRKHSQNQLMHTLPMELRELQISSSTRQVNNSSPLNARAKQEKSAKQSSKRKLFVNSPVIPDPAVLAVLPGPTQANAVRKSPLTTAQPKKTRAVNNSKNNNNSSSAQSRGKPSHTFEAVSWLNFKFDREDLLRVFSVY
ncbi:m7GpppN-mRNA hydrolase [Nilaparvata lugens]|uniref:m7GpppN-mRNA hydrolase n=1 Tax=Nilaparvata lugens TaxID=108931 RepID=UPI00193D7C66|nr:m7GpppN-mRNA hydrolase [Nilaparvata lugens]